MIFTTTDPIKKHMVRVGELIDNVFTKKVDSKKHYMNHVKGYGIQENVFQELVKRNTHTIVIKETDTNKTYMSTIFSWNIHGRVADFGAGKQRFLSKKFMQEKEGKYAFIEEFSPVPEKVRMPYRD